MKLNKLIALYDDNEISIEGDTDIAFREDVPARYRAYGWNVIDVRDGNCCEAGCGRHQSLPSDSDAPTLIDCHTAIGYGSPRKPGMASRARRTSGRRQPARLLRKNLGLALQGEPFCRARRAYTSTLAEAATPRNEQAEADWHEAVQRLPRGVPGSGEAHGTSGSARNCRLI